MGKHMNRQGNDPYELDAVLVRDKDGNVLYRREKPFIAEMIRFEIQSGQEGGSATLRAIAENSGQAMAAALLGMVHLHRMIFPSAMIFPGGEVREALDALGFGAAGVCLRYLGVHYPAMHHWPDDPGRKVVPKNWVRIYRGAFADVAR